MSGPFRRVHHLCIVVRDLERATAYYESIGIGPWHPGPSLDEFDVLEGPADHDYDELTYRAALIGDLQLQLVQPGPGDSLQRRFLETHGEGVFHVGFEVDDLAAGTTAGEGVGLEVLMRGSRPDGSGFAYFDTAADAGVILELRAGPPPADD
jgi:methylmalonyl-CoA/ethylmalonyl-CoA epimerase